MDIVLIAWVVPYLAYTVPQSVKFMRYLQPVYPALIVLGVALLRDLAVVRRVALPARFPALRPRHSRRGADRDSRGRRLHDALGGGLLVDLRSDALARRRKRLDGDNISRQVRPWRPKCGTTPCRCPVPGVPAYNCVRLDSANPSQCTGLDFYPDEGSGEARLQYIARALAQSDYIVESSNRLYGSIPKLPWRYPVTIRYYDLLFAGKLGFTKVYDETVSPHLGPWRSMTGTRTSRSPSTTIRA